MQLCRILLLSEFLCFGDFVAKDIATKTQKHEIIKKPVRLKKDEAIGILEEKQKRREIVNIYKSWSKYSCQHDYPAMIKLCVEDSCFAELTNAYAKSLGLGIFYCYELLYITVIKINSESAVVKGEIKLIQSGQKQVFNGSFQSACSFQPSSNEKWKLDDIEIDWEN